MGCGDVMKKLSPVFRILDALVGVYVVAAGIDMCRFAFFFTIIAGIAMIVAGVMLFIEALFDFPPIPKYALMVRRHWGRGIIYCFFGCITFGGLEWRYGISIFVFVLGIIYLILSCAVPDLTPEPLGLALNCNCACNCGRGGRSGGSSSGGKSAGNSSSAVAPSRT